MAQPEEQRPDDPGNPLFDPAQDVVTDAVALAALAHPLRLRLLGLLRRWGPSTASRLAARLGESSGLTSYHLRQLAASGFVTDASPDDLAHVEQSGGRERWWKAARRSTYTGPAPAGDDEAAAVSADYQRAVLAAYTDNAKNWLAVEHTWPKSWQDTSNFSDLTLQLTLDEARRLSDEIAALLARYRRADPTSRPGIGDVPADSVAFAAQYLLFPQPDQDPPGGTP